MWEMLKSSVRENWTLFCIWCGLVVIMGQAGVLFSILTMGVLNGIFAGFVAGAFYTFGIACLGATLFEFLREFLDAKGVILRRPEKVIGVVLALLLGLGAAACYAYERSPTPLDSAANTPWIKQLVIYSACILVSAYMFLLNLVPESFSRRDDRRMRRMKSKAGLLQSDGKDVAV